MPVIEFELYKCYSREEISDRLGGSWRRYLPTHNGRITCGCFQPDMNPNAPEEVLVGDSDRNRKLARELVRKGWKIPVFIMRESAAWEFIGSFMAEFFSEEEEVVQTRREQAKRPEVTGVLFLKRVGP